MKSLQPSLILAVLLSAFTANAVLAADGTINFHGKIVATTCKIANKNIQVPLGAIGTEQLANVGSESRRVPFQIELNECDNQLSNVRAQFEGEPHGDNTSLLKVGNDAANDAKGVGIQLMDEDGKQIAVNDESGEMKLEPGSNVLNFNANYVSTTSGIEAGEANGTASFTLNYR